MARLPSCLARARGATSVTTVRSARPSVGCVSSRRVGPMWGPDLDAASWAADIASMGRRSYTRHVTIAEMGPWSHRRAGGARRTRAAGGGARHVESLEGALVTSLWTSLRHLGYDIAIGARPSQRGPNLQFSLGGKKWSATSGTGPPPSRAPRSRVARSRRWASAGAEGVCTGPRDVSQSLRADHGDHPRAGTVRIVHTTEVLLSGIGMSNQLRRGSRS